MNDIKLMGVVVMIVKTYEDNTRLSEALSRAALHNKDKDIFIEAAMKVEAKEDIATRLIYELRNLLKDK